jgi:sugar phosphate isomerase/epimerase
MTNDSRMGLCWGTVERANLKELIEVAGKNAFTALQVRPGLYLDARQSGTSDDDLRELLRAHEVRVEVIDTFGPRLPGIVKPTVMRPDDRAGLELTEEQGFHIAEVLGARVINLPHYLGDPSTPLPEIIEAFGEFCGRAAKRGFVVSLEFIPGTGVPDLATGLEVVRDISNAGLLLDTWHWSRSGGTLDSVLELQSGDVAAVQISDRTYAHITSPEPFVPMTGRSQPGYGDLPLIDMLAHLLRISPSINIAVEVFSVEQRAYSLNEAARVSAVAMQRLFARLDAGSRPRSDNAASDAG